MPKLSLLAPICLGVAMAASPAWAQSNALDLHLEHQLWTRLQDHQNQPKLDASKPSGPSQHDRLVARIEANMAALEAAIPQGRRLAIDSEGAVHIAVAGAVDEAAIIALAENLLEAKVVISTIHADLDALSALIDLRGTLDYMVERSAELAAGIPTMSPDFVVRWEEAVRQSYDPDKIMPVALEVFSRQMESDEIAETVAFIQSAHGEKLLQAEQAFMARPLLSYDELAEHEVALAKSDPRRHGLYFDLGEAIQGDPDYADMAMLLRALLLSSLGEAVTEEYLVSALAVFRDALPQSRTIYAMELLPDMPESDLVAILEFFHTPAGQAFAGAKSSLSATVIEAEIDTLTAKMAE